MLAVLVFEAILIGEIQHATTEFGVGAVLTIVIGSGLGFGGAWLLTLFLKRYWIPDFLQNPVTLMALISIFSRRKRTPRRGRLVCGDRHGHRLGQSKECFSSTYH